MSLAEDPHPRNSRKLQGREGWRIRVGDYRVIYDIDDTTREVLVVTLGHARTSTADPRPTLVSP